MSALRVKKRTAATTKTVAGTKDKLLSSAERLFAQRGVKQIALHEIAFDAGAKNKFAVQYHFGDRDQLLRHIFERRLPQLEARRAEMLAKAKARGATSSPAALLEIMFVPIFELVDGAKRHTYAAFLLALYEHERQWASRMLSDDLAPFTLYVRELLIQAAPRIPRAILDQRLITVALVFLDMVARFDSKLTKLTEQESLAEAISLGVAILTAPVGVAKAN